jgi:hypothetical protein
MMFNINHFSRNRAHAAMPLLLALLAVVALATSPLKAYSAKTKAVVTTGVEYTHDPADNRSVKTDNNCDLNNPFSVAQMNVICDYQQYATFRAEYFYNASNMQGDFSEFRWYDSPTSNFPVASAEIHYGGATTSEYAIYASQGATMWVSFYDSYNACETTRKSITVTSTSSSSAPVLMQHYANECGDGVGRVQLTSSTPGVTFELYQNYGGQLLGSNTSGYFEITHYPLEVQNGSYYGKIVPTGPCVTTQYQLLDFMTSQSVSVPGPLSICEGSTAAIIASGNAPGYRWFNSAGTQVYQGQQLTVPSNLPVGNTTYSVRGFDNSTCMTPPVYVTVSVSRPASASGVSNSRVGPGSVSISATSGAGGNTIKWYSASSGGSALATGPGFATPYLSASATYYAASFNTTTGCESYSRVPVYAVVQSCDISNSFTVTQPAQICYPQNVALTAAYTGSNTNGNFSEFRWYTNNESASTPVHVEAINPGGNHISSYVIYATPGAKMWVSFYDSYNVCETSRQSVTVNILQPPTIPALSEQYAEECGDGIGRVKLISNTPGVTFELYKYAGAYQLIGSNTSGYFEIPDYPLEAQNASYYGKIAPNAPCVTTVHQLLTFEIMSSVAPIVSGTLSICEGKSTTLSATGNAPIYRWFNSANAEVRYGAQFPVPTNLPAGNTTYYVKGFSSGNCSTGATYVTVNVSPQPVDGWAISVPAVALGQGPATLTANLPGTGYTSYEWFLDGQLVQSGPSPNFSAARQGTYLVKAKSGTNCISTSSPVYVQTNNYNYIIDNTISEPGVTNVSQVPPLGSAALQQSINYFDGLGRPMQSVVRRGSPLGKDIVQPVKYDDFGRDAKKYLPYVSDKDKGWYTPGAVGTSTYEGSAHHQFYTNGAGDQIEDDASPFAETFFEPSPLNRVGEQGSPGAAWQVGTGHTIKKAYEFNLANEIILFTYDATTELLASGANNQLIYYAPNKLYKNKTIDEKQNEVIEYVDREGRTVCKKVQHDVVSGAKKYACTYYIYDDFGQLVLVLPPEAIRNIEQN